LVALFGRYPREVSFGVGWSVEIAQAEYEKSYVFFGEQSNLVGFLGPKT
jgi:hypothetical protein